MVLETGINNRKNKTKVAFAVGLSGGHKKAA